MADRDSCRAQVIYALEAAGALIIFAVLRLLPIAWCSAFGGFVTRHLGPRLGITGRARQNIRRAMPELDDAAVERIVVGMWDNLGRVIAEYPHLDKFRVYEPGGRIDIINPEYVRDQGRDGKGTLFISAHYGNWEIVTMSATHAGLDIVEIYRPANNPLVDRLITHARSVIGSELVPKGIAARRVVAALRSGRHIAMLVDQKTIDGVAVPFFGRPAQTAPALARMALHFKCPVVPVRIIRTNGAHFLIIAEPPIPYQQTGDAEADTVALLTQVNQVYERWIRDRPEQWLWLHNRWAD